MSDFTKEKIEELYANLLIDPNFEKLELLRNQPNIFEVLKLQHYEIRHSNFLGWLLKPNENHGIGDYFLRRFLIKILQDPRANHPDYIDKGIYNVVDIHQLLNQYISVYREQNFIDILIEFEKVVIVIENKINASEINDQLARYKKFIEEKYPKKKPIFVFLTKYGLESSLNEYFIEMSYQHDVLNYLNDLIQYKSDSISEQVLYYIKDYINNLNINVMQHSEANVIAEKIYRQHQDLFDFIIANRPDSIALVKEKLNELLIADGYILGSDYVNFIRFLPNDIYPIIPKESQTKKRDWKNGEAFLIEFILNQEKNILVYQIAISSYVIKHKDSIKNLFLDKGLNLTHVVDNTWYVFERKEYELDFTKFDEDSYIKTIYDNIMDEQKHKINKVSSIIIENQHIF